MSTYKVIVRGQNVFLDIDGKATGLGFFTTRFVEGPDEKAAGENAISLVRVDPMLRDKTVKAKSDGLMLFIEKITEVSSLNGLNFPGTGFSFFREGDDH